VIWLVDFDIGHAHRRSRPGDPPRHVFQACA